LVSNEYYYIRNAQGDVIGLFDKTGAQVVAYTYDSWGKPYVTSGEQKNTSDDSKDGITGSMADTVGVKNPYRYRGYRYDSETGLYYLQSRYYNAEWGRFLNADAIVGEVGALLSHNMFAYCQGNPINYSDTTGYMRIIAADEGSTSSVGGGGAVELWSIYKIAQFGVNKVQQGAAKVKPTQIHHFLTDKSKVYTKQFKSVIDKYELKLNAEWNKAPMPHQGRHPNAYHDYVLQKITEFDIAAEKNVDKFLNLFEQLKQEIIANPDMLTKKYWK
jgi:RHS repeat-associated protein